MSSIQLSTLKIFWRYSHMFFLFSNKFSDYLVLIAELFAPQVKFCLSDSWCYGLRVNCPTLSKHSSWEFFRILCVHVFNSIVDPQDFVALHSYVFFLFLNKSSDYLFLIAEFIALQVRLCLSDSWFYDLRMNCLALSKKL